MNQLIPLETVNAIDLFSDEQSILTLLGEIKKQATDFNPDPSTASGRKEIASQAHKVSRSKVVIDNAGKELTLEWAKKKKLVDSGRRVAGGVSQKSAKTVVTLVAKGTIPSISIRY